MIRLILGMTIVWGAAASWVGGEMAGLYASWPSPASGMGLTVLMALIASAAVTVAICARRDLLMLRSARRCGVRPFTWGVVIGLTGLAMAAIGVAFSPGPAADRLIMIGSGGSAALLLLAARRQSAWACRGCGYDLRSTLGRVPCPECGRIERVACDG